MPNNFRLDRSWVFVGRFPEGNLGADESGQGNHLTNVGVTYDGGAKFVRSEGDYLYRPHESLSTGFPGTTGYTDLAIWCKFTLASLPANGETYTLGSKYAIGQRSYWVYIYNNAGTYQIGYAIGHTSGTAWEYKTLYSGALSHSVRYGYGVSFDDSEKSGLWKLINIDTGADVSDSTFSTTNNLFAGTGDFRIGRYSTDDAYRFDGTIHELAISNTPKTEADFDAMAAGGTTYDVSLSISCAPALTLSDILGISASSSLGAEASQSESALASMFSSLALSAQAAESQSGGKSYIAALALESQAATAQGQSATIPGALSLSSQAGFDPATVASLLSTLTLPGNSGLTPAGNLAMAAATTLAAQTLAEVYGSTGAGNYDATLSIDASADVELAAQRFIDSALAIAASADTDPSADHVIGTQLALQIGADIQALSGQAANALLAMGVRAESVPAIAASFAASLAMGVEAVIAALGSTTGIASTVTSSVRRGQIMSAIRQNLLTSNVRSDTLTSSVRVRR